MGPRSTGRLIDPACPGLASTTAGDYVGIPGVVLFLLFAFSKSTQNEPWYYLMDTYETQNWENKHKRAPSPLPPPTTLREVNNENLTLMLKKARKLGSQSDHLFPNNVESPKSEHNTHGKSEWQDSVLFL